MRSHRLRRLRCLRRLRRLPAGLVLLTLGAAASPAAGQADTPSRPDPTPELARRFAASTFPGACMAVVRDGEVAAPKPFGRADVASGRPYTAQTVQPVGSVSKTVIGLALMRAVELGWFDLDAPIDRLRGRIVAHPLHPRDPITLRQLATHTSGIVDREAAYLASYRFGRSRPDVPLGDYLAGYLLPGGRHHSRRNFAPERPGTAYHYSNVGAALAAHLIEARAGEPFSVWSSREVLAPLGLADTGWFAGPREAGRSATLYAPQRGVQAPYASLTYPDGSLRTTCNDLARYVAALLRASAGAPTPPLTPAGWRQVFAPQFAADRLPAGLPASEANSGLFFAIRRDGSVGHTGSDYGVSAFVFFDPAKRLGKVFMTNVDVQEDAALQPAFAALWRALGD